MSTTKTALHRAALLMGNEAMERLARTRVIIFGVGGVGSWCAECLVRSGVGHLTIVDSDTVCPSNINRQLMATSLTVGQVKVEALKERLLAINPEADITPLHKFYNASTAHEFDLQQFDYVIDCIDSLQDKALLILEATRLKNVRFFSSMGAALKMDPTRVAVAEFWKVKGCPLARALRERFKRTKQFPARKFQCVYSDELLKNKDVDNMEPDSPRRVNGSLMHITATFGLTLAGLVLQSVSSQH